MRLKLSDMSPALRGRVEAALAKQGNALESCRNGEAAPERTNTPEGCEKRNTAKTGAIRREPNKTEALYNRIHLGGQGMYEAITLRLPGGSRYTPDWVKFSVSPDSEQVVVELHEVKGAYRFGSQGRALTAFKEAAALFRCFVFVWAKREKDGQWNITRYGGPTNA